MRHIGSLAGIFTLGLAAIGGLAVANVLPRAPRPAVATTTANDSVAAMGTGGLILQQTDGIRMDSEDLYVSAREVRVKYRFVNHTDQDIETIVAFPMPDLTAEQYIGMGGEDRDGPMVPFITWVDDYAVQTQREEKAMLGDRDVTSRLRAIGIPIEPHVEATLEALRALPAEALTGLEGAGLVEIESYQAAGGAQRWITPKWTLKTTYFWTQRFPAGETLAIEHVYAPAIGGAAQSYVGVDTGDLLPEMAQHYVDTYCADAAFLAAAQRGRASGLRYSETWIDYVLTTGANWSGPIRDFRLVVDKGSEDRLVSFCGENVRKIGPTQFEMRATNFTPSRDLNVLILDPERVRD